MSTVTLRIAGGRVICPRQGVDAIGVVDLAGDEIAGIYLADDAPPAPGARIIDAAGLVVAPGLMDLHVDLGEPGGEARETLETGLEAAVRGGFTAVCTVPGRDPANDNHAITQFLVERGLRIGKARVLPVAAVSLARAGERLTEMFTLREAGAVAFGDGDRGLADAGLLRRAMEYAHAVGCPVFDYPEEPSLAGKGVMHEGPVATRLGLKGVPAAAEEVRVWRAVALAEQTGARVHVGPISTAGSVRALAYAHENSVPVTASVSATHLHLTDADIETRGYDTRLRLRPPLRPQADVCALRGAVGAGLVQAITSLHRPQAGVDKDLEFDLAAPGAIGLQTALGLTLRVAQEEGWSLSTVIERLATGPADVLGREGGALVVGAAADVVVFDPEAKVRVEAGALASKARNTPWLEQALPGRVVLTVVGGRVVYAAG